MVEKNWNNVERKYENWEIKKKNMVASRFIFHPNYYEKIPHENHIKFTFTSHKAQVIRLKSGKLFGTCTQNWWNERYIQFTERKREKVD